MSGDNGNDKAAYDGALAAIIKRGLGQNQESTTQKMWGALFVAVTALGCIFLDGEDGDAATEEAKEALETIYKVWEGETDNG